jgi:response regulator RpfG family c-di-GMP phosphodiesterase
LKKINAQDNSNREKFIMPGYHHKVLVVDGETRAGKAILTILEAEKLESVYADTGEAGLEKLKSSGQPFSLIICDQGMIGMESQDFLEHAQRSHPDTIRFLVTGSLDMQNIINAVNKGCVHKYLLTPLENDTILQAINWGIEQYELFLNNEKFFVVAKKQNTKLYELNCQLMEETKSYDNELKNLDNEVKSIAAELKAMNSKKVITPAQIMDTLQTFLQSQEKTGQEKLNELFSQTIKALFEDFNDLALGNGFEMPKPGAGRSND